MTETTPRFHSFSLNLGSVAKPMRDIMDFHVKFGLPPNEQPSFLNPELAEFRLKFLKEELKEYEDACEEGDLAKAFDGLLDLVYVALGTMYLHNFPFDAGWNEVQRANMSKVRAERPSDSKRGTTFDVVKPPGFIPPDIERVLADAHEVLNDMV
jgi:predicted HAD superfamily Cof-like phosphohydrolase